MRDDPAACDSLLNNLLTQYRAYTGFSAANPNGDVYCSAPRLTQPLNYADRVWFARLSRTRTSTVGAYQRARPDEKPTLAVAYSMLDTQGQMQVLVTAGLDLSGLSALAAEAQLPAGSTLTDIDLTGTILARYPEPEKWVGQSVPDSPVVKTVLTQREGVTEGEGVDGTTRLFAFLPLRSAAANDDVFLYVGIPTTVAFATADAALTRNLLVLALVGVLALLAAWSFGDWFILRPMSTLRSAAQRLAAGDLSARAALPDGSGEFTQLANAFDEMAGALERHERERSRPKKRCARASRATARCSRTCWTASPIIASYWTNSSSHATMSSSKSTTPSSA